MLRLDDRTVELDSREMRAKERFDQLLDDGMNIHEAVCRVRQVTKYASIDPAFFDYLADR